MFGLLVTLTATGIAPVPRLIDHWKPSVFQNKDTYEVVMSRNAQEGIRFMKPMRGHEDGCVLGVCNERPTEVGNDGVLHTPVHKLVSRSTKTV